MSIKPDPINIKKDLEIIEEYKLQADKESIMGSPIINSVDDVNNYNGFGVYKKNNNPYTELHYEIARNLLEKHAEGVEGIYAHYRGYSEKSNKFGRITFPRLDEVAVFTIVITKSIDPIIMKGKIPDYFLISYDTPYSVYEAYSTQETKDGQDMVVWRIKKANTDVLLNRKIPANALIVFADPNSFYFYKEGISIDNSLNVILPTLYVLENEEKNIFQYGNFALQTMQYYKKINFDKYSVEIENQIHQGSKMK